jgi:hypothetical protein
LKKFVSVLEQIRAIARYDYTIKGDGLMWEAGTDNHLGNSELKGLSERLRQIANELMQLTEEHPKFSERLKHFQQELWAASQKLRSIH